jgi:ribose transport system substrate-binding protein
MDGPKFTALQGSVLQDWITVNSDGTAKSVYFNLPDYPAIVTSHAAAQSVSQACAGCSFDTVNISTSTFADGGVPSAVASYVQTHPDVQYLEFPVGQMSTGVRAALNSAGIGQKAKILTSIPAGANVAAVASGQETASLTGADQEVSWYEVDAMARLAEGLSLAPDNAVSLPMWLLTKENAGQYDGQVPLGSTDYAAAFQQLWKVG